MVATLTTYVFFAVHPFPRTAQVKWCERTTQRVAPGWTDLLLADDLSCCYYNFLTWWDFSFYLIQSCMDFEAHTQNLWVNVLRLGSFTG